MRARRCRAIEPRMYVCIHTYVHARGYGPQPNADGAADARVRVHTWAPVHASRHTLAWNLHVHTHAHACTHTYTYTHGDTHLAVALRHRSRAHARTLMHKHAPSTHAGMHATGARRPPYMRAYICRYICTWRPLRLHRTYLYTYIYIYINI